VLEGEVAEAAEEIVIDEEKEKTFKIGYITLYTNFFLFSQAPYLSTGYETFI